MYVRKQIMKQFLVEGTHGFYSTSILVHVIGYNLFHFKQIHLLFEQIIFECTYELFSHLVAWGENREYITRNLFSYRTRCQELLILNDTIGLKQAFS